QARSAAAAVHPAGGVVALRRPAGLVDDGYWSGWTAWTPVPAYAFGVSVRRNRPAARRRRPSGRAPARGRCHVPHSTAPLYYWQRKRGCTAARARKAALARPASEGRHAFCTGLVRAACTWVLPPRFATATAHSGSSRPCCSAHWATAPHVRWEKPAGLSSPARVINPLSG